MGCLWIGLLCDFPLACCDPADRVFSIQTVAEREFHPEISSSGENGARLTVLYNSSEPEGLSSFGKGKSNQAHGSICGPQTCWRVFTAPSWTGVSSSRNPIVRRRDRRQSRGTPRDFEGLTKVVRPLDPDSSKPLYPLRPVWSRTRSFCRERRYTFEADP